MQLREQDVPCDDRLDDVRAVETVHAVRPEDAQLFLVREDFRLPLVFVLHQLDATLLKTLK